MGFVGHRAVRKEQEAPFSSSSFCTGLLLRHLPWTLGLSCEKSLCPLKVGLEQIRGLGEDWLTSVFSMENGMPAGNPFLCYHP